MADEAKPGVAEAEKIETPTPTQAECDAAKLGQTPPVEGQVAPAPAAPTAPTAPAKASGEDDEATKAKAREAKAASSAKYETR